jgi:hypothetical protein
LFIQRVHAITSKISPLSTAPSVLASSDNTSAPISSGSSGLEAMETDTFRLYCLQTPTGMRNMRVNGEISIFNTTGKIIRRKDRDNWRHGFSWTRTSACTDLRDLCRLRDEEPFLHTRNAN